MSEAKNTTIRALDEATKLRPENPAVSRDPLNGRMMNAATEFYVDYGGAYYPIRRRGARIAPAGHDEPGPSRYINDNLHGLPPLTGDNAVRRSKADSRSSTYKVARGFVDTFKSAAACGWALCRSIRRERDIARSIALLSSLDDRTLLDIGIHRSQIAHVARYGRDELA